MASSVAGSIRSSVHAPVATHTHAHTHSDTHTHGGGTITEEDSVDIYFQNVPYNLSILVEEGGTLSTGQPCAESVLAVDLENLLTGESWHGEFPSSYVESITSKTGSFKRFGVLVKMLSSAMRRASDSVALDVMTAMDLEVLKATKMGKPPPTAYAMATAAGKHNKRYLILTYAVDFDRVHYPLPLVPLDVPTVGTLQRQVKRLRRELGAFRSLAGLSSTSGGALAPSGLSGSSQAVLMSSVSALQRDVEVLRARVTELQNSETSLNDALKDASARLRAAQDAAAASDGALEKLRAASKAEVRRLRAEITDLRGKLEDAEAAAAAAHEAALVHSGKRESDIVATLKDTNDQLRTRVRELTRQLALATAAGAGRSANRPGSAVQSVGGFSSASRSRPKVTGTTPVGPRNARAPSSVGSAASRRSASAGSRMSATAPSYQRSGLADRLADSPFARPVPRPRSAVSASGSVRSASQSSQRSANRPGSQAGVSPPTRVGPLASRTLSATSDRNSTRQSRPTTRARPTSAVSAISGFSGPGESISDSTYDTSRGRNASGTVTHSTIRTPSPYATGMTSISNSINKLYRETVSPASRRVESSGGARRVPVSAASSPSARSSHAPALSGTPSRGMLSAAAPAPTIRPLTPTNRASQASSAVLASRSPASVARAPSATRSSSSGSAAAARQRPASAQPSMTMSSSVAASQRVPSQHESVAASSNGGAIGSEIADIDSRLQQLQAFLRAAKSGGPMPAVPAASSVR